MSRIHSFEEVVGHNWLITYLKNKLEQNTLPHFLIIDGPEGLGKTTIADLIAINLAYGPNPNPKLLTEVIDNRRSTDSIKKFVMSVEGGKEAAKNVLAEMHASFSNVKVIIMDECHAMSAAAQDVFLADTEYLDDNVYIIMLTTEPQALKPTLRSRAVPIHLSPLKLNDTLKILQREVARRNIVIQGGDATLRMIAEWSENKPRTALSILSAFNNEHVSEDMIREFIGYMDSKDVLQLLQMLSGSLVAGLDYISSMQISDSIVDITNEFLKLKTGFHSYKLTYSDMKDAAQLLNNVSADQIIKFLYGITAHAPLTRTQIINAFICAHKSFEKIKEDPMSEVLIQEVNQRTDNTIQTLRQNIQAPTIESLLEGGDIIDD